MLPRHKDERDYHRSSVNEQPEEYHAGKMPATTNRTGHSVRPPCVGSTLCAELSKTQTGRKIVPTIKLTVVLGSAAAWFVALYGVSYKTFFMGKDGTGERIGLSYAFVVHQCAETAVVCALLLTKIRADKEKRDAASKGIGAGAGGGGGGGGSGGATARRAFNVSESAGGGTTTGGTLFASTSAATTASFAEPTSSSSPSSAAKANKSTTGKSNVECVLEENEDEDEDEVQEEDGGPGLETGNPLGQQSEAHQLENVV